MKHELGGNGRSEEKPQRPMAEQRRSIEPLQGGSFAPLIGKAERSGPYEFTPKQTDLPTEKVEISRLSEANEQKAVEFRETVKTAIETEPLATQPQRNVFDTWVKANAGNIETTYVPRDQWEEKKQGDGVLKTETDTSILYLPEDFKLWDVKPVAEAFSDKAGEQVDALGGTFKAAGVYLKNVSHGNTNAQETAQDLYRYGNALQTGTYDDKLTLEAVTKEPLTPEQTAKVEVLFGIKNIDAGSTEHFAKVTEKIKETIEKPQEFLEGAIFQRGKERLLTELGKNGWNVAKDIPPENLTETGKRLREGMTLSELVDMPTLKTELAEARKQSVEALSEKEREVALKIQEVVADLLPFKEGSGTPTAILDNQEMNCVGTNLLGGTLLEEAGIRYVAGGMVGSIIGHETTLLVTSDKRVYWHDFGNSYTNGELTNNDIKGITLEGKPITIAGIVTYADESKEEGLKIDLVSERYKEILSSLDIEEPQQWIVISSPERGLQAEMFNSLGVNMKSDGRYEEKCVAYEKAVHYEKNAPHSNYNLGTIYTRLGKDQEALTAFEKAAELAPNNSKHWKKLSDTHAKLGNYEAALEPAKKATELDPTNSKTINTLGAAYYDVGQYEEAVAAYQQAIAAAEPKDNETLAIYYSNLGYALKKLDRYEEVLQAGRKTVELAPESVNHWNNLGVSYIDLEIPDEAEKAFTKALALDPQNLYPRANLGEVQYKLKKYQQAEENLTQAIAMDADIANMGEPYYYLALTQEKLRKPDEALLSLRQAFEKADQETEQELIENIRKKMNELA